ncbi:MAG: uncharacterized protein QOD14_1224 [Solirubrobacterales bacterium]|jgi:uncharacterized membrane protein YedE/YeeE|nr:uncharacterized protein [Solirubrobacterales bacterium]
MRDRSMPIRVAAILFGGAFGFLLSWGQFTSPDRIRAMLLLEDPYLYEMMFSAMAIGFVGVRLLRRFHARALISGDLVAWVTERPARQHVAGAFLFGLGWAVTDSCPAPIAGQLAQGVWWSLATIAGVFVGIELYFRRQERPVRATQRDRSVSAEPVTAQQ